MKTDRLAIVVILLAGVLPAQMALRAQETEEERVARIEAMTAAQKEELAQKKKRFEELPSQEKERCKKLHGEIKSHPESDELLSVMKRYHEWLKTLSPNQLADLRKLPEKERIEEIKRLVREQQRKSFKQIAQEASPEDLETVFDWLKEFVHQKRDRIINGLSGDFGKRLAAIDDENRQTLLLMHIMLSQRYGSEIPRPGREEVEQLIPRLSPQSQKVFNETMDHYGRIQIISIWSWGALWSKAFPNVTGEQLASFFVKLPAQERDRLEKLDPKQREVDLKHMYARANFFRPGEFGERPPWEGRGDSREGRGPWRGPPRGREGER